MSTLGWRTVLVAECDRKLACFTFYNSICHLPICVKCEELFQQREKWNGNLHLLPALKVLIDHDREPGN